jgi:hypothetical protein
MIHGQSGKRPQNDAEFDAREGMRRGRLAAEGQ